MTLVHPNVLARVLRISDTLLGAAFAFEYDGRQYVATARHVVEGLKAGGRLKVGRNRAWDEVDVVGVWRHPEKQIEVAVVACSQRLVKQDLPVELSTRDLKSGTECVFYGFPHSLEGPPNAEGLPTPFLKRGILSGQAKDIEGKAQLVLDAHVNVGFSGGPIAFEHDDGSQIIAGIMACYLPWDDETKIIDREGEDTGLRAKANSGLALGHDIGHALKGAQTLGCGAT